ncbi:MAG: hypothetical protein ACREB8_02830 [Pseudolabrys sp.]
MQKLLFAGALALAAAGLLSGTSVTHAGDLPGALSSPQAKAAIDIARIKRELNLTARQKAYWPPVEAALRALRHRQAAAQPAGLVHRIGQRTVSVVLNAAAIRRLVVVARPLIATLSDDQKQTALAMAQEMGLGPVLAALN